MTFGYSRILRRFIAEFVSGKKFKSVNIWQSYKEERDCLVHFFRLSAVCWSGVKVYETITLLLVTLPNIRRFKKKFTRTLNNKSFLIWLLTTPPRLK